MVMRSAFAIMTSLLWSQRSVAVWDYPSNQRSGRESAAAEALLTCAVCSDGKEPWEGLWRGRGGDSRVERGCGARRLGRGCQADARDSYALRIPRRFHLNAWS